MNNSTTSETGLRGYSILNQGWLMTMEPNQPICFKNPRFGTLEIGMTASGSYDQWLFHEVGGGGVMALGYIIKDNVVHVMMLVAKRDNLIGEAEDVEVPGGFMDGSEAALTGAARETIEETGVVPELQALPGRSFAANRAFWYLDGEHEGVKGFFFVLNDEHVQQIEQRPELKLMPWTEAITSSRDALSGMMIGRLIAHLK